MDMNTTQLKITQENGGATVRPLEITCNFLLQIGSRIMYGTDTCVQNKIREWIIGW